MKKWLLVICVMAGVVFVCAAFRICSDFAVAWNQQQVLNDFASEIIHSKCMDRPGDPYPPFNSNCFSYEEKELDPDYVIVYSPTTFDGTQLFHSRGPTDLVVAWVEPRVAGQYYVLKVNLECEWVSVSQFDKAAQVISRGSEE